jgi:hypothetical protein
MWWKYYVHLNVNREMRPVETIPGTRAIKENGGEDELKYDIL